MNKTQNFEDASAEMLFRRFIRGWAAIEYKYNPPSALRVEQTYAKYKERYDKYQVIVSNIKKI